MAHDTSKVPCSADCPDRSPTCHVEGNCAKWDEYHKQHMVDRQKINENKKNYFSHYDQIRESRKRMKRGK